MTNLEIEDLIIKLEALFTEAMKKGDITTLDKLMHNNLLFVIPGGQVLTKKQDLDNYSTGNMKVSSLTVSHQEIKSNALTATVTSTVKMTGSFFDYNFDDTYQLLRIWQLFDSEWKVIAGSSSPLLSPQ